MKDRCIVCFKTLSVDTRFKIFEYLKKQEKKVNISSLVRLVSLRQPTVSFHVDQLTKCGLIKKYKSGREVFCKINQRCDNCPVFT